jgi:predicted acylesterase/phospholipase RssA/CRP-like cAMP-binding protein
MSTSDTARVIEWLSKVRFCRGLDAEQIAVIANSFRARTFAAGETVGAPGEAISEFWIVVEGELDSFLTDPRGREKHVGIVHQGETVGEVMILEKTPIRPARFTARTNGTLLVSPAELLQEWIKTYPQLMQNLFVTLSERFKTVVGFGSRKIPSPRLGIVASSPRGCVLAGRLATRLIAAGERLKAWAIQPSDLLSTKTWPETLSIQTTATSAAPLLLPPPSDVDRQIVLVTPSFEGGRDFRPLLGSDEVLWLMEPDAAENVSEDINLLRSLTGDLASKVRIVWILNSDSPVAPMVKGWKFKEPDIKVVVDSSSSELTRQEIQGLDRLVRVLRGISIGIALAGGGAKGMAHFGVLQSLEEAGLSFDVMSGTSAGAMAGILYASGMSPDQAIANFQRDLTPGRLFRLLPKWPNLYLVSQYRRRAWDRMLRKYLHDWRLEQLSIPFNAITVDLVQVRTVVRQQGDAVHAILESINLPIVSKPILRDGMALVDGGVLNNLPADVLSESGVDFVIGVDVSSHVRYEFGGNSPNMPTTKMRNPGSLDTLFRIFESQAHYIGKFRNRAVDFWIRPDTSGFGLAEFNRTAEIAEAGRVAAQSVIADLKQRIAELEKKLLGHPRSTI